MKALQIVLTGLIILSAVSCKKDKDGSNGKYRIKHIEYSSGTTATYQYNSNNQITRIDFSDGVFERAVYNSAGKLTLYELGGAIPSANYTVDYVYTSGGLKQEEITTQSSGAKYKVVYTNANGLLTGFKVYNWIGGSWIESVGSTTTYSYNGAGQQIKAQKENNYSLYGYDDKGNLNSTKLYLKKADNSGFYLSSAGTYTYDNKKLIYEDIRTSTFVKSNYIDIVNTGYDESGMIVNQVSQTYSYEYNSAGYVTKLFHNGVLHATYTLEKI